MNASLDRKPNAWSGLVLSQLLALAFLTICAWYVLREAELVLPNNRIATALSFEQDLGTRLPRQLFAFGAVLILCHAILGLAAFGFARLIEVACAGRTPARRGWLVAGWFAWLAGLVMGVNATWYPGSRFAGTESWLQADFLGFRPLEILLLATGLLLLSLILRAVQRWRPFNPGLAFGIAGVAALALVASLTLQGASAGPSPLAAGNRPPHVIIIGVDSLRDDLTESRSGAIVTPHIDAFLSAAHRFSDTITPMARTYGSWVTILTGRHPVSTNARVNLMQRQLVHAGVTLPDALRTHGYQTIYATDEVRFANIDESFGFDRLITPPIGAADFLLGFAGDMPLANLVAGSRAGRLLFPLNHANRAANVTYRPEDFIERLKDEVVVDGPMLLAVHLTLAHWPASWAGLPMPGTFQEYRPAYRLAIEEVDRQFDSVMRLLEDKGMLENAIVVLLSDHGEALGGQTDSMLRKTGSSREIWDSLWGHGTSVLSPHQYSVLLAMRAYGGATLPGSIGVHDWPVSLEDVRPTLEQYATGEAPTDVDGFSLLPYLEDPSRAKALESRIRFTETDFNTPNTLAGRYEASGIIDEAAVYYELDRESGWVQFRPARLPALMAQKQRAAISSETLLAAIPGPSNKGIRYLVTDRQNPLPHTLEGPPDPSHEPEVSRLWNALHARFPGELPAVADLP